MQMQDALEVVEHLGLKLLSRNDDSFVVSYKGIKVVVEVRLGRVVLLTKAEIDIPQSDSPMMLQSLAFAQRNAQSRVIASVMDVEEGFSVVFRADVISTNNRDYFLHDFAAALFELNATLKELSQELNSGESPKSTPSLRQDTEDSAIVAERSETTRCDEVRFSAIYSRQAVVSQRHPFLVYVHLTDALELASKDASKFKEDFGGSLPSPRSSKTSICLAPETPVTVYLECKNQEFEPLMLTKKWRPPFTRFEFDFVPGSELLGDTLIVQVRIQAFNVEIARIENCAIEIKDEQYEETIPVELETNPLAQAKFFSRSSEMYNRIFVSYAREDTEIVEDYRLAQLAAGNVVFMDTYSIRSGQNWERALAEFIDQADVFQLFWSEHSAKSENVQYEWDYALKTRCSQTDCRDFIRPVFWKRPLVDPPDALQKFRINFMYVPFALSGKTLEWRLYNDEFWERIEGYFQESNVILKRSVRDLKRGQRAIYRRLDQTDTNDLNAIVESLQRNQLQQQEMNEILASVEQILRVVQTHSAQVDLRTREALDDLTEAVESSLGLQQKLELALPVIPFFLDYKIELAAGSDVDLNKVWDDVKARWARLIERVRRKS